MITTGCLKNLGYSDNLKSNILEVHPIVENVKFYAQRVKKWLELRIKDKHNILPTKAIATVLSSKPLT